MKYICIEKGIVPNIEQSVFGMTISLRLKVGNGQIFIK